MLDGLAPNLTYELAFFGSRNSSQTRITEFEVFGLNGESQGVVQHQSSGVDIGADGLDNGNDDDIAVVTGVVSDVFGQVWMDLALLQGDFAYLNAFELRAVPEPGAAVGILMWPVAMRRRESRRAGRPDGS